MRIGLGSFALTRPISLISLARFYALVYRRSPRVWEITKVAGTDGTGRRAFSRINGSRPLPLPKEKQPLRRQRFPPNRSRLRAVRNRSRLRAIQSKGRTKPAGFRRGRWSKRTGPCISPFHDCCSQRESRLHAAPCNGCAGWPATPAETNPALSIATFINGGLI